MKQYFDREISHEQIRRIMPGAMADTGGFDGVRVRSYLCNRGFLPQNIVRYAYRPFDLRWLYWEPETDLLDRKREEYFPQLFGKNLWLEARQKQTMDRFDRGYFVRVMADNFGNGLSSFFPLYLRQDSQKESLLGNRSPDEISRNLSDRALAYLNGLHEDRIFFHSLALLNTPRYRSDNAGALRQDWPRIPLPQPGEGIETSAVLGHQIAALMDPDTSLATGNDVGFYSSLRNLGVPSRFGGGSLRETEFALSVGWGHAGKGDVTMPGRGKLLGRHYTKEERESIVVGTEALGLPPDSGSALLGSKTADIYLNETAYWANVPEKVWNYTIGGYQVIKKWLSYREEKLLGPALSKDEVRYVQEMVRRIAAILLLGPALDANYQAVKADTYTWR